MTETQTQAPDVRAELAQKIDSLVRGHAREDILSALFGVACAVLHAGCPTLTEAHQRLDFFSMGAKWELMPQYYAPAPEPEPPSTGGEPEAPTQE